MLQQGQVLLREVELVPQLVRLGHGGIKQRPWTAGVVKVQHKLQEEILQANRCIA